MNLVRKSIILLLLCLPAFAEDKPEAPSSSYWTKSNIALIAADATAKSIDMAFTMQNSARPGFRENDPLARPFVHSGPVVASVAQSALFAAETFASYELHKHGHTKLAKAVLVLAIGGNTVGIATSTR
jgi:hypothetical protein